MRQTGDSVTFSIRLRPRAKRNAIVGQVGDALKLAVVAPPVEGRANRACIEFLAELLHVPRSSIAIVAGESGKNKRIRVTGADARELARELEERMRAGSI